MNEQEATAFRLLADSGRAEEIRRRIRTTTKTEIQKIVSEILEVGQKNRQSVEDRWVTIYGRQLLSRAKDWDDADAALKSVALLIGWNFTQGIWCATDELKRILLAKD